MYKVWIVTQLGDHVAWPKKAFRSYTNACDYLSECMKDAPYYFFTLDSCEVDLMEDIDG